MTRRSRRPLRSRRSGEPARLAAARALDRAVEAADAPGCGLSCAPAEHRVLILAARREMSLLAAELVECRGCPAEAVARAAELARRGALPLFTLAGARQMLDDARAARAALAATPTAA
jgi:hypothetical protein